MSLFTKTTVSPALIDSVRGLNPDSVISMTLVFSTICDGVLGCAGWPEYLAQPLSNMIPRNAKINNRRLPDFILMIETGAVYKSFAMFSKKPNSHKPIKAAKQKF